MRPSVGTEPGSRVLREPHLQAVALLLLDLAKVLAGAQGVSGRFGWCFGCAKHSDVFFCVLGRCGCCRRRVMEVCVVCRVVRARPAHILGGCSTSTPRFPTTPWEIVKIHDFSLIFHENLSNLMENHGFSRFPRVSWEIWVSKLTTFPKMCAGLVRAGTWCLQRMVRTAVSMAGR